MTTSQSQSIITYWQASGVLVMYMPAGRPLDQVKNIRDQCFTNILDSFGIVSCIMMTRLVKYEKKKITYTFVHIQMICIYTSKLFFIWPYNIISCIHYFFVLCTCTHDRCIHDTLYSPEENKLYIDTHSCDIVFGAIPNHPTFCFLTQNISTKYWSGTEIK